jgi:phosphoribosylformimino-5-aminoimidazole carboxamide ribotide isomerase
MHIIPAIDIIEGKCVRLAQGQYTSKIIYDENPVEVALRFQDAGLTRLHVVDLDGAQQKRVVNYRTLEAIARSAEHLKIDFGGGIQSDDDLRIAFECGARQVTVGSVAAKDRALFVRWLGVYGASKLILAADTRDERVAVSGWEETTELSLMEYLAEYEAQGVCYVMCTDIAKDGMMQGASLDLYARIREERPALKLIASGGVSSMRDVERLAELGLYGAIIGKALYEGVLKLQDLKAFMQTVSN